LPANRWQGESGSGKPVVVTKHKAGVDFGRGPWVKYEFTEDAVAHVLQGYVTPSKGDRIQFDGKECDNDDVDFTGSFSMVPPPGSLNVIVKFKFTQGGTNYSYRFEGKTT